MTAKLMRLFDDTLQPSQIFIGPFYWPVEDTTAQIEMEGITLSSDHKKAARQLRILCQKFADKGEHEDIIRARLCPPKTASYIYPPSIIEDEIEGCYPFSLIVSRGSEVFVRRARRGHKSGKSTPPALVLRGCRLALHFKRYESGVDFVESTAASELILSADGVFYMTPEEPRLVPA